MRSMSKTTGPRRRCPVSSASWSSVASRLTTKPHVTYLYNERVVDPEAIRRVIAKAAPRLPELAELEILPTPGLTYYKLKNFGISRSTTDVSIMLDSDASPQPGWLEGLLKPFADPTIMAVGGFTVLGYDDLLSKTMALSWIFDLADERERTVGRHKIHANNCAVRTDFFRENPVPRFARLQEAVRLLVARPIRSWASLHANRGCDDHSCAAPRLSFPSVAGMDHRPRP